MSTPAPSSRAVHGGLDAGERLVAGHDLLAACGRSSLGATWSSIMTQAGPAAA